MFGVDEDNLKYIVWLLCGYEMLKFCYPQANLVVLDLFQVRMKNSVKKAQKKGKNNEHSKEHFGNFSCYSNNIFKYTYIFIY